MVAYDIAFLVSGLMLIIDDVRVYDWPVEFQDEHVQTREDAWQYTYSLIKSDGVDWVKNFLEDYVDEDGITGIEARILMRHIEEAECQES